MLRTTKRKVFVVFFSLISLSLLSLTNPVNSTSAPQSTDANLLGTGILMKIEGSISGFIEGEYDRLLDYESWMVLNAYQIGGVNDRSSSGTRLTEFLVIKVIDKSSPLVLNSFLTEEILSSVIIVVLMEREELGGGVFEKFRYELSNAVITSITQTGQINYPYANEYLEVISFSFEQLTFKDVPTGATTIYTNTR